MKRTNQRNHTRLFARLLHVDRTPLIALLLTLFLLLPVAGSAQNVFYGERKADSTSVCLYFDKDGFPYPDYFISDSSMTKAYGSLFTWFQQNNAAFIEIAAQYNCFPESIDQQSIFQLRDSIIGRLTRTINTRSQGFPAVAFYIHGFRKAYVQQNGDVTSMDEFQRLRTNLATYGKPKAFEICVYWDGLYGCCFSARKKGNRALFELYEKAGVNAIETGKNLRKILLGVSTGHVQVLAHSLGARVAVSMLFNDAQSFEPTPAQPLISVSLLVPAIDGIATFATYYNRRANVPFREHDNYRLQVVYNENDFVLQKKDPKMGLFGPGPHKYGETTLGCNWKGEAVKLQAYFREHYPNSVLRLVDKSTMDKCHSLRCYTREDFLKEVSDFLWEE